MPMQDEYYYSGSGFYEESDANVNASFTDVSELPCSFADCMRLRARRYGQWWTLTGGSPKCKYPDEAQKQLRERYAQVVTLNHPNITRAVAMIQTPLLANECVIEEYIDGVPLDEFMQTNPDEALCRKLLEQIVDAVQYCHSKGVVHGRLYPRSIMVTHQDHIAKLVDFGCEGVPQDDVRALAHIIDILRLPSFKTVADNCRHGRTGALDEVMKAIKGSNSKKWLPIAAFVLVLAAIAAGSFWTGHRTAIAQDSRQADSLPLPGIYFSDTVTLSTILDHNYFISSVTGAHIYQDLTRTPQDISEDVAVDLGLSVLWAPFNMGCADTNINHVGNFFAWCDTVGLGAYLQLDDYWPPSRAMTEISGSKWDAAHRIWGGGWRMPTHDEWNELLGKCKWSLVKQHGIPMGYKVHGPSGAEIFLPMAGYRLRFRAYEIGLVGHYWSSTPVVGVDRQAFALRIDSTTINIDDSVSLTHLVSIRPVLDKNK